MSPPQSADTDRLLERAAQGDAGARQLLLERHRARLRRMVDLRMDRRLTARFDPSDVVQEALAEADHRLSDYLRRRPVAFYPWLRGLAWDRLVDCQRRHAGAGRRSVRREEAGVLDLPDDSVAHLASRLIDPSASPSEKLVQEELRQRVRAGPGRPAGTGPGGAAAAPPRTAFHGGDRRRPEHQSGGGQDANLARPAATAAGAGGPNGASMSALPQTSSQRDNSSAAVLADLVEEFTNRQRAGEALDAEVFAAAHPDHAGQLREILPALVVLAGLHCSSHSGQGPDGGDGEPAEAVSGCLGDFRLVRQIGKGGMGVVYEAEQVSLKRRVALKVLPFAATMDSRQLQRFRNETLAASLHHGNIVPVHFVGCERGVHFYAMQLIPGCSLAALLRELRGESGRPAPVERPATPAEEAPTVDHRSVPASAETARNSGV